MGQVGSDEGTSTSELAGRYEAFVRRLRSAVLEGPADTESSLRKAVERRAAALSGRAAGGGDPRVPEELEGFIDKVARGAYRVTREDVESLVAAGYTEDELFEITVSAAVGAASARLERGMSALRGESG